MRVKSYGEASKKYRPNNNPLCSSIIFSFTFLNHTGEPTLIKQRAIKSSRPNSSPLRSYISFIKAVLIIKPIELFQGQTKQQPKKLAPSTSTPTAFSPSILTSPTSNLNKTKTTTSHYQKTTKPSTACQYSS